MTSQPEITSDVLDDVSVSLSQFSEPTLASALLMRQRLDANHPRGRTVESLDRFPRPLRLDVGSGGVREPSWVSLDYDRRYEPALLMDAHDLALPDCSVDEARAVYSLSYMSDPDQVLRELWRVLVPQGLLTITDAAPRSDDSELPKVKHSFSPVFWKHVTQTQAYIYVPKNAQGRWTMLDHKTDFNTIGERLSFKLKLSREQVLSTFMNVSQKQVVTLIKTTN